MCACANMIMLSIRVAAFFFLSSRRRLIYMNVSTAHKLLSEQLLWFNLLWGSFVIVKSSCCSNSQCCQVGSFVFLSLSRRCVRYLLVSTSHNLLSPQHVRLYLLYVPRVVVKRTCCSNSQLCHCSFVLVVIWRVVKATSSCLVLIFTVRPLLRRQQCTILYNLARFDSV